MNTSEVASVSIGKWTWNEIYNGLEFTSSSPPEDERRLKDRQPKSLDAHKGRTRRSWRVIPRPVLKSTKTHQVVTLQDVKGFSLSLLSEVEAVDPEYEHLFDKPQIDELLILLLNYFHWFFEKRSMEENPDPSHIDVSMERRRRLERLGQKLEGVTKQLGRCYGLLVLGTNTPDMHHMGAGRFRVSSMDRDRILFETFYSFCVFVVWLTFMRQEYDVIKYEVNRLFRSDSFNPSLSAKREKDTENLTDAEYRRMLGRRPSKMDLSNQRSMAMISIVPRPKEEASWLFNKDGTLSATFTDILKSKELTVEEQEQQHKSVNRVAIKMNVGIIGMSLSLFNLQTLTLNEDEPNTTQTANEYKALSEESNGGISAAQASHSVAEQ